jgi:hypothetical protein
MANSAAIPRSLLIYAVCLPVAILVGYQLAEPLESGSVALVVLVLSVLSIPVFVRWHHTLLVAAWNMPCVLIFLPGGPASWVLMACLAFMFALMGRSMGRHLGFFRAQSVAWSLIVFAAVVGATMLLTGGIGLRALGSDSFGGKKYIYIFAAIAGYFALAGQRPGAGWERAQTALFFLSGLATVIGLVGAFTPGLDFLGRTFSTPYHLTGEMPGDVLIQDDAIKRLGFLIPIAEALYCYLLARYGIRGVLDIRRPWRAALLLLAVVLGLESGFRSILGLFLLTFAAQFYWEGLFRTRYVWAALGALVVLAGFLMAFAQSLPIPMQRAISFLPVNVDEFARDNAEGSTAWRFGVWKDALPEVPKHLIRGKGYAIDPGELYMANISAYAHPGTGLDPFLLTGDYHSGPLSLAIPFGLGGFLAFSWFVWASLQALYRNHLYSDPALQRVNTFLLAYFIAHVLFFVFLFGSIWSDMFYFTGLIGLSVSLNGGVCEPPAIEHHEEEPA